METFFIADTHFGHKSICKFEQEHRPFSCLEDMHEFMIRVWNDVVRPKDKVIHLGDFSFGEKGLEIAGRLNGLKYLVQGNHDTLSTDKYLKYFHKVLGCMEYDNNILTHIPVHESQFCRYKANIHGHLHSRKLDDARYINVSAEQIGLKPIAYGELIKQNSTA